MADKGNSEEMGVSGDESGKCVVQCLVERRSVAVLLKLEATANLGAEHWARARLTAPPERFARAVVVSEG